MPSAPAAITSAALLASMPAIAPTGMPGARARMTPAMRRASRPADRRLGIVLRRGRDTRRRCRHSRGPSSGALSACATVLIDSPMIALAAEQTPRIRDRHVVPADMHAVGAGRERDIDAVVDQERHARAGAAPRLIARASSIMPARRCHACRAAAPASRRRRRRSATRSASVAAARTHRDRPGHRDEDRHSSDTRAALRTHGSLRDRARTAHRGSRPRSCPARSRRAPAISPATPNIEQRGGHRQRAHRARPRGRRRRAPTPAQPMAVTRAISG